MNEQMKKLMENEELLKGIVEAQNPDQLKKVFEENGIALANGLTIDEAFHIVKTQDDELSAENLDEVSGGILLSTALGAAGALTLAGGALSFLGGYAVQTIKNWSKR